MMTPEERALACQAEIQAVLDKHGCTIVPVLSWEPLGPVLQVRAGQIQIQANADWQAPEPPKAPPADPPDPDPGEHSNGKPLLTDEEMKEALRPS